MNNIFNKNSLTMIILILLLNNKSEIMYSAYFMMNIKSNMIMAMTMMVSTMALYNINVNKKSNISENKEEKALYAFLCLMSSTVFSSAEMMTFFIMFEITTVPMLIILLYYSKEKDKNKAMFFMFTTNMMFSVPLLWYITATKTMNYTTNFEMMSLMSMKMMSVSSFIMMSSMFLTKYPLFLTHMWLPKAHVEASTPGSMILAGVLLKLGTMGMEKNMMMMEFNIKKSMNLYKNISLTGIVMMMILSIRSIDMKKMAAVSSISHMAMVVINTLYMNMLSMENSKVMMISHGLISPLMFLLIGMMYENKKDRSIMSNKNMKSISKTMTMMWFIVMMMNMGIPPMANVVCELFMTTIMMSENLVNSMFISLMMLMSSTVTMMFIMKMSSMKMMKTNSNNKIWNPMLLKSFYLSTLSLTLMNGWM